MLGRTVWVQRTSVKDDDAVGDEIYEAGNAMAEEIFQRYVKAQPLNAVPWRDMKDKIIAALQSAYRRGQVTERAKVETSLEAARCWYWKIGAKRAGSFKKYENQLWDAIEQFVGDTPVPPANEEASS